MQPFGQKKNFRVSEDERGMKQEESDPKEKKNVSKSQSLPKLPGSQSYKPIPQNYSTFDKMASVSSR
jgi:hypothetical protein